MNEEKIQFKISDCPKLKEDIEKMQNSYQQEIKELHQKLDQYKNAINEIDRLNNIINELEKDLEEFDFTAYICGNRKASKAIELGARLNNNFILDKLKELKEDK